MIFIVLLLSIQYRQCHFNIVCSQQTFPIMKAQNIIANNDSNQLPSAQQHSLGLRLELVSSKLYLLEEEFEGRFRPIREVQDSYLRSYEISRDIVTEQRVAVRSYSALEPSQQSAVIENMESFLKLSQIQGMCKLIAFTKKVQSGIISAAFEYNDRSLQQIIQQKDYLQIRTSLYSLILRQSLGIIRNLEMIGITIEEIIPTFMLLQQIGGELKMKMLFDEREKKYDEILQGAISFASPQKIQAVVNEAEQYESVECQEAIFELGLLLLEFLYEFESYSLKQIKQQSQQFSKDAPLPRPHPTQQSNVIISKDRKVYLNNTLINSKINFLKQLNNHIVSVYLQLIVKMIQPLQKRIGFQECCTEVQKLQSIIAQTIRDDLAKQSKNQYYSQLFQTPEKHLSIEKQFKYTQNKRQDTQTNPRIRNTIDTAIKNAISQTTLASPKYTSTIGDVLKLSDPISQQKLVTINIPKQKLLFQARNNPIIRPKFNDFIDRLQQKNIVKKQYYDGSVYYGQLGLNKKRQGFGIYISNSGDIYFGTWLQNALSDGNYLFKNGESFQGVVKNGKQGWGRYFYLNGNIYEGEWRDDVKNGLGKMQYPNGDSYEGAWSRGKKNGQGKYKYATGAIYDGNFLDGKKSGFGIITFPSGTKVEAHWNRTHIEGPGRVFYNNGDYFQGNYQLSQKQGVGFYKWQDTQYEGQFKKDLMQGHACVRFSEKQSYQGRIRNGKRDGRGIYRYSNGDSFQGEWKNDQKLLGLYKFYEGVTFEGRFKENAISYGLMIYQNGQSYEGQFQKGERSGIGIYRNTNRETLYEGKWQHDQYLGAL